MEREDFKNKAKESIDALFAEIDQLEAQKEKIIGNVEAGYAEKLAELKGKKEELQAKYNQLMRSSEENWEEAKATFTSAADSFREGFSKIASLFN